MNSTRYANMMSNHPDMVQAVPAMPMDNAAWSGSNSLGNVVEFQPDVNNRQMVLKLDEWGPPEMWTISLGFSNVPDEMNIHELFRISSEIEFGSGGATQIIETDWGNGISLSLPMNAVNIVARYELLSAVLPSDYTSVRLSAMLCRGVTSSKYEAVKTLYIPQVDSDSFTSGKLPPFTRELEFRYRVGSGLSSGTDCNFLMGPGMVAGHVTSSTSLGELNLGTVVTADGFRYPTLNNAIYYEYYTGIADTIYAHELRCHLAY